jgi:hypothetical protein
MSRTRGVVLSVVLVWAAASCASTEMESTWRDPGSPTAMLDRVAVICLSRNEGMRRMAEDEVVKQIGTPRVVQSYRVLSGIDLRDRQSVKASLQRQGFDGVLVMRLAGVTDEISQVPVGSFDRYYGWAAYQPVVNTVVRVSTNLYSLPMDRLLWAGNSKTFDPSSPQKTVHEVSRAVSKELKKDRLII